MTPIKDKRQLWIVAALAGAVVFAGGGRLAYTEKARADMMDFNRKAQAAFDDPALRAEWAMKLEAIDEKKRQSVAQWGDCSDQSDDDKTGRQEVDDDEGWRSWQPSNSGVNLCLQRKLAMVKDLESMTRLEKEAMGTYEEWALQRSGLNKTHRWNNYPRELVERLSKGERGLLL